MAIKCTTDVQLGLEKFENPALAKNYANFFDTIEPTVATTYGTVRWSNRTRRITTKIARNW